MNSATASYGHKTNKDTNKNNTCTTNNDFITDRCNV